MSDFIGKILLIDDEEDTLFMMREILEMIDFYVDTAASIGEAVLLRQKNTYDYYLIDIRMNNESGLDAIPLLNINDISQKVIVLSANINSINIDYARKLGVVHFLPKPFRLEELEKTLKRNQI